MSGELAFALVVGALTSGGVWLLIVTGGVLMRRGRSAREPWLLSRASSPRLYRAVVTVLGAICILCVLGLVFEVVR